MHEDKWHRYPSNIRLNIYVRPPALKTSDRRDVRSRRGVSTRALQHAYAYMHDHPHTRTHSHVAKPPTNIT